MKSPDFFMPRLYYPIKITRGSELQGLKHYIVLIFRNRELIVNIVIKKISFNINVMKIQIKMNKQL